MKAPVLVSKTQKERKFVVDLGASMHMLSKKDLRSDEMDTLRRSRNPTTVVAANGEVQTNEEAQVCMFTISICSSQCNYSKKGQQFCCLVSFAQITDVHTIGKNGETPRLTKNGKTITCIMGNCVPSRCTRIVIIFQQQHGFYIKTNGSVKIFR